MTQYDVTGMTCAACQARVEKAVSAVPGVTACSVSLLTHSMGVEGSAAPDAIIRAVERAGYGASPKGAARRLDDALADTETPLLRRRLLFSLLLSRCAWAMSLPCAPVKASLWTASCWRDTAP